METNENVAWAFIVVFFLHFLKSLVSIARGVATSEPWAFCASNYFPNELVNHFGSASDLVPQAMLALNGVLT